MGSSQALHQLQACSAFSLEDALTWTVTPNAWKHQPPEEPPKDWLLDWICISNLMAATIFF